MKWLSRSVEELIASELTHVGEKPVVPAPTAPSKPVPKIHDAVVVGSGYGGAVSALRLSQADVRVLVLERGEEWLTKEFPNDLGNAFSAFRIDRKNATTVMGYESSLFEIRMGDGIGALVGNGLGGTSLINANVVIEPDPRVFDKRIAASQDGPARAAWPENLKSKPGKASWDAAFAKARAELSAETFSTVDLNDAPGGNGVMEAVYSVPKKHRRLQELSDIIARDADDQVQVTFEPADLTVALGWSIGAEVPPRLLNTCVGCGDCVSGCNQNAKKSLDTTYLAKAHAAGAQLFTGVSVLSVEHRPGDGTISAHWVVHFVQTQARDKLRNSIPVPTYELHARHVVLSAGTFGSTEILMRSAQPEKKEGLALSKRLGQRLSTNGDGIAFGFAMKEPVHGIGNGSKYLPDVYSGVGPTITGSIRIRHAVDVEKSVLIQDAAIPGAIASLFHEAITSAATFAQLDEWDFRGVSWDYESARGKTDWAVLQRMGLENTQTLLSMGHDASAGSMAYDPQRKKLVPTYPSEATFAAHLLQEKYLEQVSTQGAIYIQNPAISFLPKKIGVVLSAAVPGNAAFTVHPLGGCCMADTVENGVVNEHGKVFKPGGTGFWEGLYVLDGAVIPTSLGANPLLTITALAERAMDALAPEIARNKATCAAKQDAPWNPPGGWPDEPPWNSNRAEVKVHFTEAMRGELEWNGNLRQAHLLLHLPINDLSMFSADGDHRIVIPNQQNGLSGDREQQRARLRLDEEKLVPVKGSKPPTFVRKVGSTQNLWVVSGEVAILPVPNPPFWQRISQCLRTALTWLLDRGFQEFFRLGLDWLIKVKNRLLRGKPPGKSDAVARSGGNRFTRVLEGLKSLLKLARHASESRMMRYNLTLVDEDTQAQQPAAGNDRMNSADAIPPQATYYLRGIKFVGYPATWAAICRKVLSPFSPLKRTNLWVDFGQLRLKIANEAGTDVGSGTLNLDLLDMSRMHAPQLGLQRDTPNALLALLGYPLWFARLLIKTRLWDFRLPDYPDRLPVEFDRDQGPIPDADSDPPTRWPVFPALRVFEPDGLTIRLVNAQTPVFFEVKQSPKGKETIQLGLTRYRQPEIARQRDGDCIVQAKVLLMLNGFAQSTLGLVPQEHRRHTSRPGNNECNVVDEPGLAECFYEQGFDVWLFDYRTSSLLDASKLPCTMDDIAQFDIPMAVELVLATVKRELGMGENDDLLQIYAFAHCVGASSMAMSLLDGKLVYDRKTNAGDIVNKLAGVTLSQMHAYLVGGLTAQLRLQAGGILRDTLGIHYLRMSAAERKPTPLESLLDRLFASLPSDQGELCPHENGRYFPRPGICTCKRLTGSISRMFKHDMIKEETHDRLPIYFGRANTTLLVHGGRCVENERLVNADGQNVYVTDVNIAKYLRLPIAILHGAHNALFDVESARRTHEQFSRVNFDLVSKTSDAPNAFDLIVAKDFAHFDCTIGYGARMQQQILKPLKAFYDKAWRLGGHLPPPALGANRPGELRSQAKAPLAGPILGWSREGMSVSADPSGKPCRLMRLWIEVDESESDEARYAVTVVYSNSVRQERRFVKAQLWPIVRVPLSLLPGKDAKDLSGVPTDSKLARVAIALADLELPVDATGLAYEVEMFSVHNFWLNELTHKPAQPGGPAAEPNPAPQRPGTPRPPGNLQIGRPITPDELDAANQYGQPPGRGTTPAGIGGTPLSHVIKFPNALNSAQIAGLQTTALNLAVEQFAVNPPVAPVSFVAKIYPVGDIDARDAEQLWKTLAFRDHRAEEEAQRGKPSTLSRDKRHLPPNQNLPYTAKINAALLAPASAATGLRFVASCCRHPGLGYEDMRADASFARIAELLDSDPKGHRDLMLLLGDQIYADASYGLIDNPSLIEKIAIRNRRAFSARGFNSVSSRVPTYMVIDDHEIDDMWSIEDRISSKQVLRSAARNLFGVAVASFAAYQWSHGPRNSIAKGFNCHFEARGMAFFALDTRTQRERFSKPPVVCTTGQLDELEQWLGQFKPGDTSPKFIATGSLLVTGLRHANLPAPVFDRMAETWQMAPLQRAHVLATIARNKVKNVVFLTGDIHCDATAELAFSNGVKAYAIVTPPLYAPLPGANSIPSDVLQQETVDLGGQGTVQIDAIANSGSGFADIHVDPLPGNQWRLSVNLYRLKLDDKAPCFRLEIRRFLLG